MKIELEEKLFTKYNHLFEPEEIRKNEMKSCMAFGFDCEDGWFNLLNNMLEEISNLEVKDFYFTQIKEKFGTLRVYSENFTNEIDTIIDKYEKVSENTCEVCGELGELISNKGWWRVRCALHEE